jgi:hypothetical protein
MAVNATRQRVTDTDLRPRAPVCLWLSVPIAVLAIVGSIIGITLDETIYEEESANWAAQAVGQDIANLVAFPALLALAFLAARGSLRTLLAWVGILVYTTYSYAIYVFDIQFGPLFLVWVAVFGLSIFALIGALGSIDPAEVKARFGEGAPVRATAWLLTGVGSAFYLLWLSDVIPSLVAGTTPDVLVEAGVPTNPMHVLDLAVFLPTAILAGTLLSKRRPWGYVLTPVILVAMVFISLGIVWLTVVVAARGLDGTPAIGVGIAVVALVELVVVTRFLRAVAPTPGWETWPSVHSSKGEPTRVGIHSRPK